MGRLRLPACGARAEAQGRRRNGRFDLFGSRRRHAELNRASHCDHVPQAMLKSLEQHGR